MYWKPPRLEATVLALQLSLTSCATPPPNQNQANRIPVPPAPECTIQNLTPESLFDQSKSGVAVVETDDGQGSAFVIRHQDGNTLMITNSHVPEDSLVVKVKWSDGSQDEAVVVAQDSGDTHTADLALLQVKGTKGTPLKLKRDKPSIGSDIIAIGAPRGLEFSLSRGVVSSIRENGDLLQIDAAINPGNSGGPVLDKSGCVVGVATFKLRDSEGLNFAIASSAVEKFIAKPTPPKSIAATPAPIPLLPRESEPPPRPQEPSQKKDTNCWFQQARAGSDLIRTPCMISTRINFSGQRVIDLEEPNGMVRSIVLWNDKRAEVLLNGTQYEGTWTIDSDKDVRVKVNDGVFAFTP